MGSIMCKLVTFGFFLAFCIMLSRGEKCENIDLMKAENSFLTAFALEFNIQMLPPESQHLAYCLKNKTEKISIKQIPRCYKPRYCLLCRGAMNTLITGYKAELSKKSKPHEKKQRLIKILVGLCQVAEFAQEYCIKLAGIYVNAILEILQANPTVLPKDVCSMALAPLGCSEGPPSGKLIPAPVNLTKPSFKSTVSVTRQNVQPMQIIHITDVHYDPAYVESEESPEYMKQCERTFGCCRNASASGSRKYHWGSYFFCDTPKTLFDVGLRYISEKHIDAKLIYLTGDLVRHHITEVDFETLKKDAEYVFQQFMYAFEGRPILFALGNHDTDLFGMFSPSKESVKTGQRDVYKFFKDWTVKLWNNGKLTKNPKSIEWPADGEGYYTVQLKERLRLIVLNSNVAYFYNWWLLTGHFYSQQLQWLSEVLVKAETAHQKVHILSHIPPNHHSLVPGWSEQYQRLVERFKNTIVAQFNGHSHNDEFVLFYDAEGPVSVAWNGGSFTPHAYNNPNYHVVTVEPKHFNVTTMENYSLNLDEANGKPDTSPEWKLAYNMTDAYDLPDLSLQSLDLLVNRMAQNETLTDQILRNKLKNGPRLVKALTPECRESTICDILTTKWGHREKCKSITSKIIWSRKKDKVCSID